MKAQSYQIRGLPLWTPYQGEAEKKTANLGYRYCDWLSWLSETLALIVLWADCISIGCLQVEVICRAFYVPVFHIQLLYLLNFISPFWKLNAYLCTLFMGRGCIWIHTTITEQRTMWAVKIPFSLAFMPQNSWATIELPFLVQYRVN